MNIQNLDPIQNKVAGYNFHNSSLFDFDKLIADPNNIATNLRNYINGFSEEAREIIEQFEFDNQITKQEESNLLFLVLKRNSWGIFCPKGGYSSYGESPVYER